MVKRKTNCPGWLKLSEDRTDFIFLPDRAKIVRQIFELSIAGLGGFTIAKNLNAKSVPAFGPSPNWDQSTIHNLLRNRATIGEYQLKKRRNGKLVSIGDPVFGYYPPVIEPSLFEAAQEARQKNLASGRGRKGQFITNLFAGITTCFYCGAPIKFRSNGRSQSLVCMEALENRGCYRQAWSYQAFEDAFFEFVLSREKEATLKSEERNALTELTILIRALAGSDVYDARLNIAMALRQVTTKLALASAGPTPIAAPPTTRVHRDAPGRFFEACIGSGPVQIVHPVT